jgi:MoaA/NifB/PqqE/SkfB family radical SAM enzyme
LALKKYGNLPQYLKILKRILERRLSLRSRSPVFMSHLATEACNARCPFCFWKYPRPNELNVQEVVDLYRQAQKTGIVVNGIWGGEPLLRPDIGAIIRTSGTLFPMTVLYTNGWLLEERLDDLASLDVVFVSIDAVGAVHDQIRGLPGLFERTTKALAKVKATYPYIRIMGCCVLSTLNSNQVLPVSRFAKEIGMDIFFGPLFCADGETILARNKEQVKKLERPWEEYAEEFRLIKELKGRGFPISNSQAYCDHIIAEYRSYRCHWPKITLTVYSDGDIEDCRTYRGIENIRNKPLADIIRSTAYRQFVEGSGQCPYGCRGQDPVEASKLWDFHPRSLWNYAVIALRSAMS